MGGGGVGGCDDDEGCVGGGGRVGVVVVELGRGDVCGGCIFICVE